MENYNCQNSTSYKNKLLTSVAISSQTYFSIKEVSRSSSKTALTERSTNLAITPSTVNRVTNQMKSIVNKRVKCVLEIPRDFFFNGDNKK